MIRSLTSIGSTAARRARTAVAARACAGRTAICELHQGVIGGPDSAIMYTLQTLRARSYDLVILIENDVLLSDGWFAAMYASIERAETAGFRVGAATVRVFAERVLSFNGDYCLMLNSGAGFIALRGPCGHPDGHYRTLTAQSIEHFRRMTGIDVSPTSNSRRLNRFRSISSSTSCCICTATWYPRHR